MNNQEKQKRLKEKEQIAFMDEVDAALHRRPRIGARGLSLGTAVAVILFLIWANHSEIDEVSRGQGQVISSQHTQVIENLEGGILQEMLVYEGQIVDKGTPLARLSNETAESLYRDALGKSRENTIAIIRLRAELEDHEPVFPADLAATSPQIIEDQLLFYATRKKQRTAELEVLHSQCVSARRIEEENRKQQAERELGLALQQVGMTQGLVARNLYSKVDFLNQQQKVAALQGDISVLKASIPKAEAAAQEALQKYELRKAEMNSQIVEEINKRRAELASLTESLAAGSDRVTRTELKSPRFASTIKQIMLKTVGGVAKPGEPIMEIVPLDDTLLVETRIRPGDIAFIRPNQKAMVKVTAYDFSIYGGLQGEVEQISADTIEDRKGDLFYVAKIRTTGNAIIHREEQLPNHSGHGVRWTSDRQKKTILDFLLKPILKAKQDALRER